MVSGLQKLSSGPAGSSPLSINETNLEPHQVSYVYRYNLK